MKVVILLVYSCALHSYSLLYLRLSLREGHGPPNIPLHYFKYSLNFTWFPVKCIYQPFFVVAIAYSHFTYVSFLLFIIHIYTLFFFLWSSMFHISSILIIYIHLLHLLIYLIIDFFLFVHFVHSCYSIHTFRYSLYILFFILNLGLCSLHIYFISHVFIYTFSLVSNLLEESF